MGLLDFFSSEAGQGRRKWLDKQNDELLEAIQYFAGPGVDVKQATGLLNMFNPVNDMGEAMADTRDGDYIGAAINTASALAPAAAWKLAGSPADDIAGAVTDTLAGFNVKAQGAMDAGRQFAGDESGAVSLAGGGLSDPTKTGWTFKDVDTSLNRIASKADNRRMAGDTSRIETLPIRELYATQPTVNADFAETTSSAGEFPFVVRKDGKLFVKDGHHRITKAAESGEQNVKTRFLDLDGRNNETPLLDYDAADANFTREYDDLLAELLAPQGITAYHGSPHDFDRFSMDAIGTGEGAQDLGQGMHFYDERGPAELYRNPAARWGDLKAMQKYEEMGPSRLYEVNIKANPDQFLDTKSLASDLPEGSRMAARRDAKILAETDPEYKKVMQEHMRVSNIMDGAEQDALADGFVGFKRKRNGGETEMSVFDENLIEIVRKYGVAGAAMMLGVTAADIEDAMNGT